MGMSRTPGNVMQQPMRGGPMMSQQPMMQQQSIRNRMSMQGMQQPPMQPPMGMSNGHRMPLQQGGPMGPHQQGPPPPGYQNQWNGPNQQMGNYYFYFF